MTEQTAESRSICYQLTPDVVGHSIANVIPLVVKFQADELVTQPLTRMDMSNTDKGICVMGSLDDVSINIHK